MNDSEFPVTASARPEGGGASLATPAPTPDDPDLAIDSEHYEIVKSLCEELAGAGEVYESVVRRAASREGVKWRYEFDKILIRLEAEGHINHTYPVPRHGRRKWVISWNRTERRYA